MEMSFTLEELLTTQPQGLDDFLGVNSSRDNELRSNKHVMGTKGNDSSLMSCLRPCSLRGGFCLFDFVDDLFEAFEVKKPASAKRASVTLGPL